MNTKNDAKEQCMQPQDALLPLALAAGRKSRNLTLPKPHNQYLLSAFYISRTVTDTEDAMMGSNRHGPCDG